MANALKKVANFLGLVDDEEFMESTVALPETRRPRSVSPISTTPSRSVETPSYLQPQQNHELRESVIDRIITLHPRVYSEARTIGEHYRSGQPVIMNLSDMEESERKRIIDFASGLVFGHHGSIERVTSKVFLLTPPNVSVSNEEKSAAANASFFNQS
jgi:cell division inhibitor SepF